MPETHKMPRTLTMISEHIWALLEHHIPFCFWKALSQLLKPTEPRIQWVSVVFPREKKAAGA
jgi:hypothetical protein